MIDDDDIEQRAAALLADILGSFEQEDLDLAVGVLKKAAQDSVLAYQGRGAATKEE